MKQGIKQGKDVLESGEDLSTAKKRLRDNDPYNFPELDATVASVLSSETDLPYLNDQGDRLNAPGRRLHGYTEQEYSEAFFGKDMTRRLQTENLNDPLFVTQ